jgi:hypothetical protein
LRVVCLVLVWCCGVAAAQPCLALAREQHRADRWNLTWRLLLTSGAIVQTAAALTPPLDQTTRNSAAVGAGKSFIGAAGVWIMPLRLEDGTRCNLEHASAVERRTFWLLDAGSFVVNASGAVVEAQLNNWTHAAIGFALGYTVGLVQAFTVPRLHLGSAAVSAIVTPAASGWTLSVGGAF